MNLNSNIFIVVILAIIMSVLSIAWYVFYTNYLKKHENMYVNSKNERTDVLKLVKFDTKCKKTPASCQIELPNTDDNIADILQYIKKSDFTSELLENLYELTRI